MTAITATTTRHMRLSPGWVIAFLAVLVAGLTAALVVSLTSSSSSNNAPAAPAQQLTSGSTAVQPGTGARCPGSVKDWTC